MHQLKGRYINIRTRQDKKLDWLPIQGGHQLDPETKEVASFGCDFASILFAFDQARSANANIVTNGDGKRINQVLTTQIEGLEKVSQIVKQGTERGRQTMQTAVKSGISPA
jgi:hypothetical protein